MRILHLSDIHAKLGQPLEILARGVAASLRAKALVPDFVVASGDFGYQGSGTEAGAAVVSLIAKESNVSSERIVCCPGNHEIDGSPEFHNYRSAIATLLCDANRAVPDPCLRYSYGGVDFLVMNSAYHRDWSYGEVDVDAIANCLSKHPLKETERIAVVHHHCIPYSSKDPSQIRNAYPLLRLLDCHEFNALLHGHRHIAMSLKVGKGTRVIGVGSLNFPPQPNISNQFNFIDIGKRILRFRRTADAEELCQTGPEEEW
jgi:predicted MPP superfamily phosphohydrolase